MALTYRLTAPSYKCSDSHFERITDRSKLLLLAVKKHIRNADVLQRYLGNAARDLFTPTDNFGLSTLSRALPHQNLISS